MAIGIRTRVTTPMQLEESRGARVSDHAQHWYEHVINQLMTENYPLSQFLMVVRYGKTSIKIKLF